MNRLRRARKPYNRRRPEGLEEDILKLTDDKVKEIDNIIAEKEKEIMEV